MHTLSILFVATSLAQSPALKGPPPVDCHSPQHQQLDFWVGEWTVSPRSEGSGPRGRSTITKLLNDCAINEHFVAQSVPGKPNYEGVSYFAFDTHDRRWQNYYLDTKGRPIWFVGGSDGKGMIFWSFEEGPLGSAMRRVELTPEGDGSVRQSGFISTDNGRNWVPIFDLNYRRIAN